MNMYFGEGRWGRRGAMLQGSIAQDSNSNGGFWIFCGTQEDDERFLIYQRFMEMELHIL